MATVTAPQPELPCSVCHMLQPITTGGKVVEHCHWGIKCKGSGKKGESMKRRETNR